MKISIIKILQVIGDIVIFWTCMLLFVLVGMIVYTSNTPIEQCFYGIICLILAWVCVKYMEIIYTDLGKLLK